MGEEEQNELDLASEGYVSPLHVLGLSAHEIYLELKAVGFPDSILAQIIAHMLLDILDGMPTEDDEESDFYDEDDVDFGGGEDPDEV